MARVTVEDCIDKVDSPYELVLVAKERATQLNSGLEPTIDRDNDKNTVISLREIGEGKVSIKNLEDLAITKLREHQEETVEEEDLADESHGDDFHSTYKGEISKSGTAILPSKRVRRIPEKLTLNTEQAEEKVEEKSNEEDSEQNTSETLPADTKSE